MGILAASTSSSRVNKKSLARRWATEMCRGKVGGNEGMCLLDPDYIYSNLTEVDINAYHNARDPGELPYIINPNLWCSSILDQLTCIAIHKDDCGTGEGVAGQAWRARYGGIAVTKRHIVGTAHAFSHAAGTWGPNLGIVDPTRIRFIDMDGNTVDRVQIHQASWPSYYENNPADALVHLYVGVLDEDLPDSIYIPRVAPSNYLNELAGYQTITLSQEWQPQSGLLYNILYVGGIFYRAKLPGSYSDGVTLTHIISGSNTNVLINVSGLSATMTIGSLATAAQVATAVNSNGPASALVFADSSGNNAISNATGRMIYTTVPNSNYPILNRQMFSIYHTAKSGWYPIGSGDSGWNSSAGVRTPEGFVYGAYGGDSGTASMVMLNGEMVFCKIVSGSDSNTYSPTTRTWAEVINGLIAAADANAISLGRLDEPTGYTVGVYDGVIL